MSYNIKKSLIPHEGDTIQQKSSEQQPANSWVNFIKRQCAEEVSKATSANQSVKTSTNESIQKILSTHKPDTIKELLTKDWNGKEETLKNERARLSEQHNKILTR